jgi:hypothetical protein
VQIAVQIGHTPPTDPGFLRSYGVKLVRRAKVSNDVAASLPQRQVAGRCGPIATWGTEETHAGTFLGPWIGADGQDDRDGGPGVDDSVHGG